MDTALVRAWHLWCGEQSEVLCYVRKCVGPSSVAGTMYNVAEVKNLFLVLWFPEFLGCR